MRRGWVHAIVAIAALAASAGLRARLTEERRALGLAPRREAAPRDGGGRDAAVAEGQVAVLSAGLGVFRAVAIDFLWLRAIRLQEKGSYFEAAALARLIAGLQPKLAEVWRFQAWNLAYNITPCFPPEERWPWVLRGMRLLRDEGLLHNPGSPAIQLDLAFLFAHKVGLDLDEAGPLYRSALAATFEAEPGSPRWLEAVAAWKLDPDRLRALEASLGVPLDLRAAGSHALFWARGGLERLEEAGGRLAPFWRPQLAGVERAALGHLFGGGHAVRSAGGERYAFVPDLRFAGVLERALESGEETGERAAFFSSRVAYLYLHGRAEEARAAFEAHRSSIQPAARTPDELLVPWAREAWEGGGLEPHEAALDASLLLDAIGERALAGGFREAARLLLEAARAGGGAVPAFEEALAAARARVGAPTPPAVRPRLPFRLDVLYPEPAREERR